MSMKSDIKKKYLTRDNILFAVAIILIISWLMEVI